MAQPTVRMKSRDHRARKNGHAAEQFAANRKAQNALRGRQRWDGKQWVRERSET